MRKRVYQRNCAHISRLCHCVMRNSLSADVLLGFTLPLQKFLKKKIAKCKRSNVVSKKAQRWFSQKYSRYSTIIKRTQHKTKRESSASLIHNTRLSLSLSLAYIYFLHCKNRGYLCSFKSRINMRESNILFGDKQENQFLFSCEPETKIFSMFQTTNECVACTLLRAK